MTYDQLEVLDMIVEKGSFKAASQALHRTQPTLSVAIKKLEEEFDLLLFSRDAYRPVLTAEGKVFHAWARQTLKSFRDLTVIGKELGQQKVEPELTIVIDSVARFDSLKGIFSECLSHSRPTVLTLRSEVLEGGFDLLLSDEVDFAIAPAFSSHADIEAHDFDRIELIPCLNSSLVSKFGDKTIDLENLTQIIVRTPEFRSDNKTQQTMGVREAGRKCYVTDHAMKKCLIREGFGWGRLARHEIVDDLKAKHLTVLSEELAPSFSIDLKLMRNRRRPLGPVGKAVWTSLLQSASAWQNA